MAAFATMLLQGFETICCVNHRLARDATSNQASPTGLVSFNYNSIQSELAGSDASDISSRSSAHYEDLALASLSHTNLT
tara:strand:+ start:6346 stop:6582 length:237 start_codon:yes stop_codon:yes gene_type:complete